MLNLKEIEDGIKLEVKVQPRSSKNQIIGEYEGALKIKLTAAPVEGEANQALIKFLADLLSIPKRNVVLVKGESSRNKTVIVKGINKEELLKKIGQC
ncbi:MAG: YggU family protein [Syntrophomonadaceae bacterium]|nr:YggU family protein [Syntrophomonadaceae bacterium]